MAVVIPGMEMPRCCFECWLRDSEMDVCNALTDDSGYPLQLNTSTMDIFEPEEHRPPIDCPLIEVEPAEFDTFVVKKEKKSV